MMFAWFAWMFVPTTLNLDKVYFKILLTKKPRTFLYQKPIARMFRALKSDFWNSRVFSLGVYKPWAQKKFRSHFFIVSLRSVPLSFSCPSTFQRLCPWWTTGLQVTSSCSQPLWKEEIFHVFFFSFLWLVSNCLKAIGKCKSVNIIRLLP